MAGIFASLAFQWAGRTNRYADQFNLEIKPHRAQKLYYGTANFVIPGRQPVMLPPPSAAIDVKDYLEGKLAAFKAHASQAPLFPLLKESVQRGNGKELFHLAASSKPGLVREETDLFEGVDDNGSCEP
jgi:LmbE family N-acetylglucosaminyl deacetylase